MRRCALIHWLIFSHIIHANNLVDPPDERGHLQIHARHIDATTTESPGHESGQLVETVVLTHQRTTAVSLAGVISLLATGTETARGQNEDLLRYRVHLPNTFRITHDRNFSLTNSQGNWSGCNCNNSMRMLCLSGVTFRRLLPSPM